MSPQPLRLKFLRLGGVLGKLGYKSPTSVTNDRRDGLITQPVKLGLRANAWPEYEVDAVMLYRIAGKSKAEIKELVQQLHARRAAMANLGLLITATATSVQPRLEEAANERAQESGERAL